MKWITHQSVGAAAAFALGMPVAGIAGAWFGSVLPDIMDQKVAGLFFSRQKAFNRIHRGLTHWFGLWFAALVASQYVPLPALFSAAAYGVAFGGMSHVALDMCTPSGVPLVPWSRKNKFSLKICKTGSLGEYVFLIVAVLGLLAIRHNELLPILHSLKKLF